jgi:hypothetical protein
MPMVCVIMIVEATFVRETSNRLVVRERLVSGIVPGKRETIRQASPAEGRIHGSPNEGSAVLGPTGRLWCDR